MSDIRPFTIEISDEVIDDLRQRLAMTRWPEAETPEDWSQGIPLAYTREVVEYWQSEYDMQRLADRLNAYDNFITEIDGLDIVIDGADEYDPRFQLIKGGGAALLREKIVAQESSAMVVVADDRKRVETLGAFPLPIEVTPFSHEATVRSLSRLLDCRVNIRMAGDGPVITDNGNMIADAHTGPNINDPESAEMNILLIAGVVQVGLFNNMCDAVVLAGMNGVETVINPNGRLNE